jgi:hypothetical protein
MDRPNHTTHHNDLNTHPTWPFPNVLYNLSSLRSFTEPVYRCLPRHPARLHPIEGVSLTFKREQLNILPEPFKRMIKRLSLNVDNAAILEAEQ